MALNSVKVGQAHYEALWRTSFLSLSAITCIFTGAWNLYQHYEESILHSVCSFFHTAFFYTQQENEKDTAAQLLLSSTPSNNMSIYVTHLFYLLVTQARGTATSRNTGIDVGRPGGHEFIEWGADHSYT